MKQHLFISALVLVMTAARETHGPPLSSDEPMIVDRSPDLPGVRLPSEAFADIDRSVLVDRIAPDGARSPEPTLGEWSKGVVIEGLPQGCAGTLVREWMRISCESESAALIAGSAEGVRLSSKDNEVSVILPIAPGDRRLVELRGVTLAPSGYGSTHVPDAFKATFLISESWIGQKPEIIVDPAP